jgi:hypothetical protein
MPIRMYLAGRSFDPKLVQNMSTAFQGVCTALSLKPIDDAVTRLVAEKIIELAGGGTRGPVSLHLMALKEFQTDSSAQAASATSRPTLSDGSELIEPIPCERCGALAYLVQMMEMRTFQCPVCGHRMERPRSLGAELFKEGLIYEQSAARTLHEQPQKRPCW